VNDTLSSNEIEQVIKNRIQSTKDKMEKDKSEDMAYLCYFDELRRYMACNPYMAMSGTLDRLVFSCNQLVVYLRRI
jgi:hypothetical protein